MFTKYSLLCLSLISCCTLPQNIQEGLCHNTTTIQVASTANNDQHTFNSHEVITEILALNRAQIASKKGMLDQLKKSNDRVRTNYFYTQLLFCAGAIIERDLVMGIISVGIFEVIKRKSLYTQQDFYALQEQIKQDALIKKKLKMILTQTNTPC